MVLEIVSECFGSPTSTLPRLRASGSRNRGLYRDGQVWAVLVEQRTQLLHDAKDFPGSNPQLRLGCSHWPGLRVNLISCVLQRHEETRNRDCDIMIICRYAVIHLGHPHSSHSWGFVLFTVNTYGPRVLWLGWNDWNGDPRARTLRLGYGAWVCHPNILDPDGSWKALGYFM